jgi:peptidoglycan/xylan/chitin deacetylase (PgdA/CDA1 family)
MPTVTRARRGSPLVLCYHAVSAEWDYELAVSPDSFRAYLAGLLAAGFAPVGADEAVQGSGRLLHVTFDDAFESVLLALPILEELGLSATVFACAGYAETGAPLVVPELRAEAASNLAQLATLQWERLRMLADHGIEIGSHTITHAHLTTLSDPELDRELVESKRVIEANLGRPCRFLAYPFGEHDARVREASRAAGYEAAFALSVRGNWVDARGDPFQVPRIGIWRHDDRLRLAIKTSRLTREGFGARLIRLTSRRRA